MTSQGLDLPAPSIASSESETRHSAPANAAPRHPAAAAHSANSTTTRKRASRAGTRSVNTLSPAQLDRKRANDREAQRAIRARTKEHIEKLERRIRELEGITSHDQSNEQLLAALKRIKELEEENSMLRTNLEQANFALGVENANSAWQDVPHLRQPSQPIRVTSQPESRPTMPAPSSQFARSDPSAYAQHTQWQSSNPFASSRGGPAPPPLRESPTDSNQHWRYGTGRGRAQTTPVEEYNNTKASPGAVPQPIDYTYMMDNSSHATASSRANSQPSLFHNTPQAHDQHMRHLSEQLGLSPVEMNQYGPAPQQQQQQRMSMHTPQSRGAPAQMQAQSPQYQQPPPGRLKPSPIEPSQQQLFYGPYSR